MTREEKQIKKQNGLEYAANHIEEITTRECIKNQFNQLKNKKIGQLTFEKNGRRYILVWSKPSSSMKIEADNQELIIELNQVNISNALEFIKNNL